MNTLQKLSFEETYRPGFLAEPLGWIGAYPNDFIFQDPVLLRAVWTLTPIELHRVAMSLAMIKPPYERSYVSELLKSKGWAGVNMPGLARALSILPRKVMPPDRYRQLAALLNDKPTARWIKHMKVLDASSIQILYSFPTCFRKPAFFQLLEQNITGLDHFVDGLRHIAEQLRIDTRSVVEDLSKLNQTDQIFSRICALIDDLPLPEILPEKTIGAFQRVDRSDEIRLIAREWKNCLSSLIPQISDGKYLVYLSESERPQAVALLSRAGRLGWLVEQIRGPQNFQFDPTTETRMLKAFRSAKVHQLETLAALRDITARVI